MEIGALLRDVLRRAWVVAVLVALAAGGAWAATADSKNLYSATLTITVPSERAETISSTAQYVANFVAVIKIDDVVVPVSKKTGVSEKAIKRGISAQQQGSSSIISVRYESHDKATVAQVVKELTLAAAAKTAESTLIPAKAKVDFAKQNLEAAKDAEAKADAAVQDYQASRPSGLPPDAEYQQALSDLNRFRSQLEKARNQNQSTAAITAEINRIQGSLKSLQAASSEFSKLVNARANADDDLKTAREELQKVTSDYNLARLAPTVEEPRRDVTSGRVARIRAVMISAGIAAIIGFALLVLLAGLTAGRGRRVQSIAAGGGAAAPPDSLLGGYLSASRPPVAPASPYAPPRGAPTTGEPAAHDDLLAYPPTTSPTQAVRRRDIR